MSKEKLVRKTLRSLLKRFAYKVMAIEEAKDVMFMKLEALMGSVRTFEMNFEEELSEKKAKGIALKADTKRDDTDSRYDDEDLVKSFEMLTKNM